jgi:hypothetical protein
MLSFFLFVLYLAIVSFLGFKGRQWWLRVETLRPHCIYYFGPFVSQQEALDLHRHYLEDLEMEGAEGISFLIEQGSPAQLTVCEGDRELAPSPLHRSPTLAKGVSPRGK